MSWSASGTLYIEEEWTGGDAPGASGVSFANAFDLRADLLSTTLFPVNLYAQRSEDLINRTFAPTLRNTSTTYGANFSYNSPILPTTLSISHTTATQTDLFGNEEFQMDQNQLQLGTSFQPFTRNMVTLNYGYTGFTQNNPGLLTNNSETHTASASHQWIIDEAGNYTLSQYLDYTQQSGSYPFSQLRLSEHFRMRFTADLESNLDYTLQQLNYPTSRSTSNTVSATLTHRLYESLTTTGRFGYSMIDTSFTGDSSGASTESFSLGVGSHYTKKVYMGRLGASLALGYAQSDNSAIGEPQQVQGDVERFNDPQPIILTQPGVNPNTVAVFDATGTRQFVENLDYTVATVGDTVQINRVVGGNIPNDAVVRLNYNIDPLPGYSSRNVTFGAGLSYTFDEGVLKGLHLYARYYQVQQTITPASSSVKPDDIRDFIFGAEYRAWKITLRVEQEIRDSSLAPFDALRMSASYTDTFNSRTTLNINLSQNFYNYPLDHNRIALTTVDGRLQYQIARDLNAVFSGRWRFENETSGGTSNAFEQQAELRWTVRQTEFSFIVRHTSLDALGTDSESFLFQVGFTRNF